MSETTVGTYLKKSRTAKKISLETVSHKTKISTTQLANLEQDRFDLLPSKPYIIGYLKSYAKILGVDQEILLELLEATYNPPTKENLKYFPVGEQVKSGSITKIAISGTLVLAISVWAIFFFYNKTQDKLTELKSITPQEVTAETPLQADAQEIAPPKEIVATPGPEPEPPPQVVAEPKTEVEEKLTFYTITKTLYSYRKDGAQETIDNYLPIKYQNSVKAGNQNVFVNAVYGDSWLTYKADDGPIRKFVLKKGRSILIRGKAVRIFLGNVKSTEMFLNNRPLSIDSRTGVKSLVFPQEEKGNYHLPLFVFKDDGSVITSEEFLSAN